MVAVILGDIIASRQLDNQEEWLNPLKNLLSSWGERPKDWEILRGDFFQLELSKPEEALLEALKIKALLKQIKPEKTNKTSSNIDVRLAIGIGHKSFSGERISESNGSAFVHAGEKFDLLKKENINLAVKSPWPDFDEEINLYLKLASVFIDKWSVSSAEMINIILRQPQITQEEIGRLIGIKQSGVSRRMQRAHAEELLELERIFRKKLKPLLS